MDLNHDQFYKYFHDTSTELEERISALTSTSSPEALKETVNVIRGRISTLTKELADASPNIPRYDQRNYNESLKTLTTKLNTTAEKAAPKPRFQFRRTARSDATTTTTATLDTRKLTTNHASASSQPRPAALIATATSTPVGPIKDYNRIIAASNGLVRRPSFSEAKDVFISGHNNYRITLPSTASAATASGRLTDIDGCVVDMSGATRAGKPFAGFAIKNVKQSVIISGTVDGPVHITGISDSVLVIVARQARIHECRNVDIYLHCGSRPIIEDCKELRFAPVPDYYAPGESLGQNQWDQVDDFKWLKVDKSPNWDILQEEKRVIDDVWKDVETDVSSTPSAVHQRLR